MIKQLVKSGKIDAKTGLSRLLAKADLEGGAVGVAVFKGSQTYKWLVNRVNNRYSPFSDSQEHHESFA